MDYLHKRVSAGSHWLDESVPGWERKIHLEDLDIRDESRCVLGQLFGDYSVAIVQYDLSSAKQV